MLELYKQPTRANDRLFKMSCWAPQGVKANLHPFFGNDTEFFNRLVIGDRSEFVWLGMLSFM